MITRPCTWKLRAVRRLDQRNSGSIHLTHLVERLRTVRRRRKMVRKSRKRVLAGLMTLLVTSIALAQNPARVDFSLRSIDGQTVTSDSLRGEVVYWVSTESDDPKSKNHASDEQLRAFSNKYGLKVTVLRDPEGVISKKFGVDQLPSFVILDKQGNISGGPIGGLDPNGNLAGQLASRLDKLL